MNDITDQTAASPDDREKEQYWTSILTGDTTTIPDEVRRKAGMEGGAGDDEENIALAVNRSWAVDHLGTPREEVRTRWGDIRSQLARQFGTAEDERELFAALSFEQRDMKPLREAVRKADMRSFEQGFDGEGLPDLPELAELPAFHRRAVGEAARAAHLEGAAERKRLMPVADLVWNGMKTILPQEVPLDEEEKNPGLIEDAWRRMSRSLLDEPGSGGMDPVRMIRHAPDLAAAVDRLASMNDDERGKVYRILQKRAHTEKKDGLLKSVWRNFTRGRQDINWGIMQAVGNAVAAGGEALGGDSGTLFGWDIRKSSQTLDRRLKMLEEMRRTFESEILPLRLDEHANVAERTVVDASRSVAPALLSLCGGLGFGALATSGVGGSMAEARQSSPDGDLLSQQTAALAGGAFDAVANIYLSKVGGTMLKNSIASFAGRHAVSRPAAAYLGAAKNAASAALKDVGIQFAYDKVSPAVQMGMQELAALQGGYDSGIDWKEWGKSRLDWEMQRREAASVLPFLLIGSGRVGLHHFKSVPAVLGDGARLRSWGVPDGAIRQILAERDKVWQGEMLRQAIVKSPKWGGFDFIHQATAVLNLLSPVPGYVFKNDGAVRDFLNLPADYQPPKYAPKHPSRSGTAKAYEKYGLMGDPAACKKAFELWDEWWNRGGLMELMTDANGKRDLDACAVSLMWRESRNLAELAAEHPREVLPSRVMADGVFQPNIAEDARVLLYDRMREVRQRPFRLLMSRETVDGLQLSKKPAEFWKTEAQNVDERMRTIVYEGVIRLWRGEEKNRVLRDVARSVWKVWSKPASGPEWRAGLWLDREGGEPSGGKEKKSLPIEERLTEMSEHLRLGGTHAVNAVAPELRQACRLVWGAQADVRMLMALMPRQRDFDVAMSRGFSPEDACAYLLQRELDMRPATLAKWAEYLHPSKVRSLKTIQDRRNALIRVRASYERFCRQREIEPTCVTGDDGLEYWRTIYPNGTQTRWHRSEEDMLADWGAHVAGMFAPAGQSREALLAKWQNGTEIVDQSFEAYKGLREKEKMSVFEDLGIKASHDLLNQWYGGVMHRLAGESVGKPMNYRKMKEDVREVLRPLARVTVRNGGLMGREHDPLTLDNPIALVQGKSDSVWHRLLNTRVLSSAEAVELLQRAGMKIDAERLVRPENRRDLILELTELSKRYFMDHLDDPSVPPDLVAWVRYAAAEMPATMEELTHGRIELEKKLPSGPAGLASRRDVAKWAIRGAVAEVQRLGDTAGSIRRAEQNGDIPAHLLGMLRDAAGLHPGIRAERAWMNERFPGRTDVFSPMERFVHLLPSNRFTEQIPAMTSPRLRNTLSYVTSFFGLLKSNDETARGPWSERSLVRLDQLAEVLKEHPDLHEWSIDRHVPGRFRHIVGKTYGPHATREYEPAVPEHYRSEQPKPHKDYEIAENRMLPERWRSDPSIEAAIRTLDALRRYSARVPVSTGEGVARGRKLFDLTGEHRPHGVGRDWSLSTPLSASRRVLESLENTFEAFGIKLMKMGRGRPMRRALESMIVYRDPERPGHVVRLMPGFPDAANVLARSPYVVHSYKGVYLDVNGRPLSPGKMYRSYIPLEKFRLRPLDLGELENMEAVGKRNLLWHLGWAARRSYVPGKLEAPHGIVPNVLELMIRLEDELGQGDRWKNGKLEELAPRDMYLLKATRQLLKQPDMLFLHHEDNMNGLKNFLLALSRSYRQLQRELGLWTPPAGDPNMGEKRWGTRPQGKEGERHE